MTSQTFTENVYLNSLFVCLFCFVYHLFQRINGSSIYFDGHSVVVTLSDRIAVWRDYEQLSFPPIFLSTSTRATIVVFLISTFQFFLFFNQGINKQSRLVPEGKFLIVNTNSGGNIWQVLSKKILK